MKFWKKALRLLDTMEKSMQSIYSILNTFKDNVFFERLAGGHVVKSTYAEFDLRVKSAASKLQARLSKDAGAFVALEGENSPEWVECFWAILMAGFKPVLINTRLPSADIDRVLAETKAVAVLSDNAKREGAMLLSDLVSGDAPNSFTPSWDDAFALSTSGTSGEAKIFMYDGASMCAQIYNSEYVVKNNPTIESYYKGEIKLLAFLPFYHIFGLVACLMWFSFFGRTFVFLKDYKPETIQYACKRHGVTHFFAVPIVFNGVAAHVRRQAKRDGEKTVKKLNKALAFSLKLQSMFPLLSRPFISLMFKDTRNRVFGQSVKFCISGGGYLKDDALVIFNGFGYNLNNGFGMTEIGIASVELRQKAKHKLLGSVGKPFPSAEYKLDDEGKLLVRGESIHCARVVDGVVVPRNREEFFDTGDIFSEQDGHYYIKGRVDDIIVSDNGELIAPDNIEKQFELRYAQNFSVLGIKGESVETVLVIHPNPHATPSQIDQMLISVNQTNKRLPLAERLNKVYLSDQPLPLALESKVRRGALKKMLESGTLSCKAIDLSRYDGAEDIEGENYKQILLQVREVFCAVLDLKEEQISDTGNFITDLGGSSMEYFSLLDALSKRFNVSFALSQAFLSTPREFAEYIIKE